MRLLHISDWHLGATLGHLSRAGDHEEVLEEEVRIAREFRPHLIVHTGDLFDWTRPAVDDLRRGFQYLGELAGIAPIVVLAGNHDSPPLFEIFNLLLSFGGLSDHSSSGIGRLTFVPRAKMAEDGGILCFPGDVRKDVQEEVRLAPLPFVLQNAVIDVFGTAPEQWTAFYADQIALLEENLGNGLNVGYDGSRHINLFAAHLFVAGAALARSERPVTVSERYATRPDQLPQVSYAAFGHIHRPQAVPGLERARYAGSAIQIDYGEEGETKTVVTVEAEPGRTARVEPVPLTGGRPLLRVEGTLEELEAKRNRVGRSILTAVVHSEEPIVDLSDRLTTMFPDATLLDAANPYASGRVAVVTPGDVDGHAEPSINELFAEYLATETPDLKGARAKHVREHLATLLGSGDARPEFAETHLFEDATTDVGITADGSAPTEAIAVEEPSARGTGS